ncbi:DUF542 domain-containing protein [Polaribacter sp. Asnod1-A03]|uniref:DUF542 domain-containing protein n=1 Tax=Polaribacter sp. Asnod1-A03 TaxID=3160581 RepID=UPI0038694E92
MKSLINKSVAGIVTENINTASIFKKYKIDFSFHGNMLLSKVCEENNIKPEIILEELKSVSVNQFYLKDYNSWELDFLIDFLINIHHEYEEENVLLLKECSKKAVKIHGKQIKELIEINKLIQDISDEMLEHMKNEETVLFPYIKKLIEAKNKNKKIKIIHSPLNEPIDALEDDHNKVGKTFKRISFLTNNYKVPENACNTLKVLYVKLQQFEEELKKHIHLENNILFPKAKKLERTFYNLQ